MKLCIFSDSPIELIKLACTAKNINYYSFLGDSVTIENGVWCAESFRIYEDLSYQSLCKENNEYDTIILSPSFFRLVCDEVMRRDMEAERNSAEGKGLRYTCMVKGERQFTQFGFGVVATSYIDILQNLMRWGKDIIILCNLYKKRKRQKVGDTYENVIVEYKPDPTPKILAYMEAHFDCIAYYSVEHRKLIAQTEKPTWKLMDKIGMGIIDVPDSPDALAQVIAKLKGKEEKTDAVLELFRERFDEFICDCVTEEKFNAYYKREREDIEEKERWLKFVKHKAEQYNLIYNEEQDRFNKKT